MLPPERRDERFSRWMQDLDPVNEAIALVLMLARGSARPRRVVAEAGFFQEALDIQAPAQLVRVSLNGGQALFPEISGHKSRFSIRFMSPDVSGRPPRAGMTWTSPSPVAPSEPHAHHGPLPHLSGPGPLDTGVTLPPLLQRALPARSIWGSG